MVDCFVDCVAAKEDLLREERKLADERTEPDILDRLGTLLGLPLLNIKGQRRERKGTDDSEKVLKRQMKTILEKVFVNNLAKLSKAPDEFVYVTQKDLAGTT